MTRTRKLGALLIATPLALGLALFGAPTQAAAKTSVLTPSNGQVITSGSQITARGHFDFAITMELRAKIPGVGDEFLTSRHGSGDISGPIPMRRNGKYTVYLVGRPTNTIYDSNTFTVRIPPAAPSGVAASVSGSKLLVRWNLGGEVDLKGYTVSATGMSSKTGSTGSMCSGSACSTTFAVPASQRGKVKIAVRANRSNGSGGTIQSGSASASASLGNGPGGGGSADGPGGSAPDYSVPPPSTSPLTPYNSDSPFTLPSVQPDGATAGFTYPAPLVANNQRSPDAQNVASTDSLQWGKSAAIALILLIIAAHLGTWTRRLRTAHATAGGPPGGVGRARVDKARAQITKASTRTGTTTAKPPAKPAASRSSTAKSARPAARTSVKRAVSSTGKSKAAAEPAAGASRAGARRSDSKSSGAMAKVMDAKARGVGGTKSRGTERAAESRGAKGAEGRGAESSAKSRDANDAEPGGERAAGHDRGAGRDA